MRFFCPAKINLDLRVGPLAADGYHPLRSWMVAVGLFDTLDVSPISGDDTLRLSCSDASLDCGPANLVMRAAMLLREAAGSHADLFGSTMHLTKCIPAGGGLGGGSSDAATTLVALNRLWQLDLSRGRLVELAAQLGSDVPFFLGGPSTICTGRGERLRRAARPTACFAVLLLPPIAMPTPAVYRRFDALPPVDANWTEPIDDAGWAALPAIELLSRLRNDLEPPAFALRPELAVLWHEAKQLAGRPVRMSGSGSTLFTLFDDGPEAEAAAKRLDKLGGAAALCVAIAPETPADVDHV